MTPAEALIQGPLLGTTFAMLLYGVMSMQTYLYFLNYRADSTYIRIFVGTIWVLETTHTVFSIHFIQHYLIANFGNVGALSRVEWSLALSSLLGLVIGWIVNLFFIGRIWLLSRKPLTTIIAIILSTARAVFGIYVCNLGFQYNTWEESGPHALPYILAGQGIEVVVNTLITSALSYELLGGRSGIREMDALINQLLIFTVNTGALTSLAAIGTIIAFLAAPHSVIFLAFSYVQSKLYANCLLATLNARKGLRDKSVRSLTSLSGGRDVALRSVKTNQSFQDINPYRTRDQIEISKETVVEKHGSSLFGKSLPFDQNREKSTFVISLV